MADENRWPVHPVEEPGKHRGIAIGADHRLGWRRGPEPGEIDRESVQALEDLTEIGAATGPSVKGDHPGRPGTGRIGKQGPVRESAQSHVSILDQSGRNAENTVEHATGRGMEEVKPTTHQAMARFRASLLRRASAVAWVVMIIISAQAVRESVFSQPAFWVPMAGLAALLVVATAARWDRIMATPAAPWVATGWLIGLIVGITALAIIPELTATAQPILFGIAAVSGLLLTWWAHALVTVVIMGAISFIAFTLGSADAIPDVLAPVLTVAVVAAATALVGLEFEREAVRSVGREQQIDQQRLDFERLYEVSATLARAESLAEIVPHLIGTICKYLDAQVGVVLLYNPDRHRLEVMSPIWVNGYPLDADPIILDVAAAGVVTQTYRAGKPFYVREVDPDTESHILLKELGLKQALVAPLKVESLRVGVIIVGDPYVGTFTEDQLEQLGSLAAPAGLVLSQIGRYEAQADMTRRLEEVAQMKSDFVSTVSHELRTPLTSIIGSLDTVNRPELAPTQPTAQQLLSTAAPTGGSPAAAHRRPPGRVQDRSGRHTGAPRADRDSPGLRRGEPGGVDRADIRGRPRAPRRGGRPGPFEPDPDQPRRERGQVRRREPRGAVRMGARTEGNDRGGRPRTGNPGA